jgi:tetratricopeptide (TPR) repeat protein
MLSLSMIVRDEAAQIEACLRSVQGFADELVVVDTGSTDNTVALAQALGARVEQIEWPGDFAPARNQALQFVSGDWVLVLDADEQLRPEAIAPLRALMAQPDVLLINLLRHERGAVQSPYSNVSRLFRRHPAIRWSRAYHSMVDDSVGELLQREPQWRIADCPEPALLHDGYRPELLAQGNKPQRLREAMEAELKNRPGDPYACAKLGSLEVAEGNLERGVTLLRQGLEHCPADAHPERYELLLHLALAQAGRDAAAAIALYRQALELPLAPRLSLAARLNLAALLLQQGQAQEAEQLCRRATAAAPEIGLSWYNLGLIRRRLGDIGGALEAYREARRLTPEHAETHQNLAVALLLGGDIDGARSSFRQAISLLGQQGRSAEAEYLRQQAGAMVKLEE